MVGTPPSAKIDEDQSGDGDGDGGSVSRSHSLNKLCNIINFVFHPTLRPLTRPLLPYEEALGINILTALLTPIRCTSPVTAFRPTEKHSGGSDLVSMAKFLESHIVGDGNKYKSPVIKNLTDYLNN
ncbi:hypothetical protein B0H19DRAFT_1061629 [Mycena capillaripes]|nr:hypothetical protein B0H19DRAFT_1061629 [Mycena capillaripes]